jgi:hypothetical protein
MSQFVSSNQSHLLTLTNYLYTFKMSKGRLRKSNCLKMFSLTMFPKGTKAIEICQGGKHTHTHTHTHTYYLLHFIWTSFQFLHVAWIYNVSPCKYRWGHIQKIVYIWYTMKCDWFEFLFNWKGGLSANALYTQVGLTFRFF